MTAEHQQIHLLFNGPLGAPDLYLSRLGSNRFGPLVPWLNITAHHRVGFKGVTIDRPTPQDGGTQTSDRT
ncbi:hypothetical protein [Streptomyces sennicomposti]